MYLELLEDRALLSSMAFVLGPSLGLMVEGTQVFVVTLPQSIGLSVLTSDPSSRGARVPISAPADVDSVAGPHGSAGTHPVDPVLSNPISLRPPTRGATAVAGLADLNSFVGPTIPFRESFATPFAAPVAESGRPEGASRSRSEQEPENLSLPAGETASVELLSAELPVAASVPVALPAPGGLSAILPSLTTPAHIAPPSTVIRDADLDALFLEVWDQGQTLFADAMPVVDETIFLDGIPTADDMPAPGAIPGRVRAGAVAQFFARLPTDTDLQPELLSLPAGSAQSGSPIAQTAPFAPQETRSAPVPTTPIKPERGAWSLGTKFLPYLASAIVALEVCRRRRRAVSQDEQFDR
jgi:hypothetical protein